MSLNKLGRVLAGVGVVGVMGAIAYQYLFRPWAGRWGAMLSEIYGRLPGDGLIRHAKDQYTHAITIEAPVAAIWPWLVQVGQGRGGFYSHDWLENLFGLDIHSVNDIIPECQGLAVGDLVRMTPHGGTQVAILQPERDLVLYSDPETMAGRPAQMTGAPGDDPLDFVSTWSFHLRPIDDQTTRLITRARGAWNANFNSTMLYDVLLPIATFIMSRKMLRGIKQRAEEMI